MDKLQQVLDLVSELSQEQYEELRDWLLMDGPPRPRQEDLDAEMARRLAEIDAGTAKTIPWQEVRRQLWKKLGISE